jgi:O-antigen/teichoic acid export membrane protein
MYDLKQRALRGGVARLCAQGMALVLRIGSLVVLARLLTPNDFGLINMATLFTTVLFLLRDFGLSAASVQRSMVSEAQISGLFWINILIGAAIWVLAAAAAPSIAAFYGEPRLYGVTVVLAASFFLNALGVQHAALLQRQMRFTALALINVISSALSMLVGIAAAMAGYGYWALVVMSVAAPLTATLGVWLATGWVPGSFVSGAGMGGLLRFGSSLTLTTILVHIGYNAEKVIIGHLWGASAIGIYGRAYQIISIPTDNINAAVGEVAFATLSRLQDNPVHFRNYFRKLFSLVLGLTVPITIACGLFADDIVYLLLGPNWNDAIAIVRLLAPTILVFAIINPLGWVVFSLGLTNRGLKAAPAIATLMVTAYILSLPYGPKGIAFAYSSALTLWVVPHIFWCLYRTPISVWDIVEAISRPLCCGIAAGGIAISLRLLLGDAVPALPRLLLESGVLFGAFFGLLLFAGGQKSLYLEVVRGLRGASVADGTILVASG